MTSGSSSSAPRNMNVSPSSRLARNMYAHWRTPRRRVCSAGAMSTSGGIRTGAPSSGAGPGAGSASALALLDGDVVAVTLARVDLPRTRDLRVLVVEHLHPLRQPAGRA